MSTVTPTMPATVEELLAAMVRLNTINAVVSGDPFAEQKLLEFNERVAQAMGFATRRLAVPGRADNLLVTLHVDAQAPWVMFESHMDTVTIEGMTIPPLEGFVRDGRLWGRGSCDTKGTGAAMLWALRQYAAQAHRPNNIAIVFAVDEEFGMTGSSTLARAHLPTFGWKPKVIVVGEPTMLQPIVAHNGIVRWKMVARGVAAHSSNPSRGRSAITAIMRAIDLIENKYAPSLTASDPMCGKAQCSVNIVRGGTQINIIPEHCEAHCDRRVVPGEDYRTVMPAVQKLLDPLRRKMPDTPLELEVLFENPPLSSQCSSTVMPVVNSTLESLGLKPQPQGVMYGTDASNLAETGVPTFVLGPGDITQAHTKDEWIELEQLRKGVEVYRGLMQAGWR